MPNREVEDLMVVKVNRCRIDGCRRTEGHSGEHMDSEALSEHVIASHERYINELESRLDSALHDVEYLKNDNRRFTEALNEETTARYGAESKLNSFVEVVQAAPLAEGYKIRASEIVAMVEENKALTSRLHSAESERDKYCRWFYEKFGKEFDLEADLAELVEVRNDLSRRLEALLVRSRELYHFMMLTDQDSEDCEKILRRLTESREMALKLFAVENQRTITVEVKLCGKPSPNGLRLCDLEAGHPGEHRQAYAAWPE